MGNSVGFRIRVLPWKDQRNARKKDGRSNMEKWRHIIVYGEFNIPHRTEQGKYINFFIFRYPDRRVPWSKKIAPALDRLVQSFVPDYPRSRGERKKKAYWNVDGGNEVDGSDLRDIKIADQYEWTGSEIRKVEDFS
jgi:hypothetical protein